MDDTEELADLLGRAAAGDSTAQAELFSRYRKRLKRMVRLRLSRHLGAKMRDAACEVSLHRGAMPAASSASLTAQLLGRLPPPSLRGRGAGGEGEVFLPSPPKRGRGEKERATSSFHHRTPVGSHSGCVHHATGTFRKAGRLSSNFPIAKLGRRLAILGTPVHHNDHHVGLGSGAMAGGPVRNIRGRGIDLTPPDTEGWVDRWFATTIPAIKSTHGHIFIARSRVG